jgi:DeoR family ulaG and ulaABCDEF operon transcriptional repressor
MHERERHNFILRAVRERPVATVQEICEWTGASEATVRRDIAALHLQKKLRRVRGGAEALHPVQAPGMLGRPYEMNEWIDVEAKRAIADAAVELCEDGDSIIINGGTTTFQMVHGLAAKRLNILTNSFPIAEHLIKHSACNVTVPGDMIYREQKIILSPFDNDVTGSFNAGRLFMGAQGVGGLGVMESDPLLVAAEQKLIGQAAELVVLVASHKLRARPSLICCPLDRVHMLITDDGITEEETAMLEARGVLVRTVAVAASKGARSVA